MAVIILACPENYPWKLHRCICTTTYGQLVALSLVCRLASKYPIVSICHHDLLLPSPVRQLHTCECMRMHMCSLASTQVCFFSCHAVADGYISCRAALSVLVSLAAVCRSWPLLSSQHQHPAQGSLQQRQAQYARYGYGAVQDLLMLWHTCLAKSAAVVHTL